MMKRQNGFTLVELVVVIVILGILAVTAAPKFLNLQQDAREASIQGLKGAMDSAAGIVYGKAALQGADTSATAVTVAGVSTIFGYPAASKEGIGKAVEGLENDWADVTSKVQADPNTPEGYIAYSFKDAVDSLAKSCHVKYYEATKTEGPRTVANCAPAV